MHAPELRYPRSQNRDLGHPPLLGGPAYAPSVFLLLALNAPLLGEQ